MAMRFAGFGVGGTDEARGRGGWQSELQLYVDDHAAHVANCASADDDAIPLMSAETFPRLEGGIRAALDEADSL